MNIEKIREEGEKFFQSFSNESYLFWTGRREKFAPSHIYDEHEELFSTETYHMIEEKLRESKGEEKKTLTYLKGFVGSHIIKKQVRWLQDRILALESTVIKIEEEQIPFNDSLWHLSNAEIRSKREKIDEARREIICQMNPLLKDMYHKEAESIESLGFDSYSEMFYRLYGLDLGMLRNSAKEILHETEDAYKEFLEFFLRRNLGIKLGQAKRHDLLHLLRAQHYDHYFNPADMFERIGKCMREMGLDVSADGKISLDIKPGQNRWLALWDRLYHSMGCIPMQIPKKIMLVGMLRPGKEIHQAFLHNLGHGIHYCHMDEELPFELKRLGDSSISEAFAFVWDELPLSRKWLERYVGLTKNLDFIRFCYLGKLYYLRRYAAKLSYEILLFEDGLLEGKEEAYKTILTEATMVDHDAESYLYDAEHDLLSGRYIRGWILQGQIIYYLRDHYDEEWFRRDISATFLKELWNKGGGLTAEELSRQLGYSEIDVRPMLDMIFEHLR